MSVKASPDASKIALNLLKVTEDALFAGDFAAFLSVSSVPYTTETFDGIRVFQTPDELAKAFHAVVADNAAQGITGYQRDLVSASFHTSTEIKYAYVTRRLSGHMLADGAYPSIAIAQLVGDTWKIVSAQHAKEDAPEFRAYYSGAQKATESKRNETR